MEPRVTAHDIHHSGKADETRVYEFTLFMHNMAYGQSWVTNNGYHLDR